MRKKRKYFIIVLMSILFLSSCSFGNPCGEYGECSQDIDEAREFAETIEDMESIELISCTSGLASTDKDGIPSYGLVEDQSGICLILIETTFGEQKLYSFGSKQNTKELDVTISHSIEEVQELLNKKGISFESTRLSIEAEYSDNIYLSIDELHFTFLEDDLKICDYMDPALCVNFSERFGAFEYKIVDFESKYLNDLSLNEKTTFIEQLNSILNEAEYYDSDIMASCPEGKDILTMTTSDLSTLVVNSKCYYTSDEIDDPYIAQIRVDEETLKFLSYSDYIDVLDLMSSYLEQVISFDFNIIDFSTTMVAQDEFSIDNLDESDRVSFLESVNDIFSNATYFNGIQIDLCFGSSHRVMLIGTDDSFEFIVYDKCGSLYVDGEFQSGIIVEVIKDTQHYGYMYYSDYSEVTLLLEEYYYLQDSLFDYHITELDVHSQEELIFETSEMEYHDKIAFLENVYNILSNSTYYRPEVIDLSTFEPVTTISLTIEYGFSEIIIREYHLTLNGNDEITTYITLSNSYTTFMCLDTEDYSELMQLLNTVITQ